MTDEPKVRTDYITPPDQDGYRGIIWIGDTGFITEKAYPTGDEAGRAASDILGRYGADPAELENAAEIGNVVS